MSETTANLKRKIATAGDLHSVVRTMKALAASSIGQYEKSVQALEDYSKALDLGLSVCLRGIKTLPSPPLNSIRTAIIFGSDQGLVGQFNEAMSAYVIKTFATFSGETKVWAVGTRLHSSLQVAGLNPEGLFAVPNSVNKIISLVGQILVETHLQENVGEFFLFYNQFNTSSLFTPFHQRLLPLDETWKRKFLDIPWPTKNLPEKIGADTLPALIREYLFISLFRGCAESLASENASRLAAMQRADKNIDELLENLEGTFNHLRQSQIDEELFDVVSAYEVLSVS